MWAGLGRGLETGSRVEAAAAAVLRPSGEQAAAARPSRHGKRAEGGRSKVISSGGEGGGVSLTG